MSRHSWTGLLLLSVCLALAVMSLAAFEKPVVHVAPSDSVGPRTLEPQTRTAVVRDYFASWQSLSRAMQENNPSRLDTDFIGVARDKLRATIQDQQKTGMQTRYQDRSHDIELVFYSPEGLSVQLLDTVEYDVEVVDHEKVQATQHVRTRYLAVLSPTEVRWKVRVFQAAPVVTASD